jgi:hypothetical protein
VILVGKYNFRFERHKHGGCWTANLGRLVVRKSPVRPGMWLADYKVGGDDFNTMRRDGVIRRYKTKENAMKAVVKFWNNI